MKNGISFLASSLLPDDRWESYELGEPLCFIDLQKKDLNNMDGKLNFENTFRNFKLNIKVKTNFNFNRLYRYQV